MADKEYLDYNPLSLYFLVMRKFLVIFMILGLFIVQSCVETHPFRVGDNIDIKNSIAYMDNLEPTMNSIAKSICSDNLTSIAIGNFIDMLNEKVDRNGEYLATDLAEKISNLCGSDTKVIDNAQWIKLKNSKISASPPKNFNYFIIGTYRYTYKGYDMFVRVFNAETEKPVRIFAKKICNKHLEFDIDNLHIPSEVVIEPLW